MRRTAFQTSHMCTASEIYWSKYDKYVELLLFYCYIRSLVCTCKSNGWRLKTPHRENIAHVVWIIISAFRALLVIYDNNTKHIYTYLTYKMWAKRNKCSLNTNRRQQTSTNRLKQNKTKTFNRISKRGRYR